MCGVTRLSDAVPVTKTVLVVDDQDAVRDVVRLALEGAGYRVLQAGIPSDAVDLARSHPGLDLVIADVVMPEMDAFELVDRISHEVPGVRILYISGYTDAREEGPFIQKPFTPAELLEKVWAVLAAPEGSPQAE
jgi:two-component system cell cycle sensor histidine kinase/response regulator CckA